MSAVPVKPAPRRGWCPGLARPMPTGDGMLVRLHPVAGRLSAAQARAAARAAREGGNGLLDVTARGNLQIRGVTAESHAHVVAILGEAGLGDVRHDGGPQRLTLSAPFAGAACLAVVAALEAIGREVPGLPAKTLVAVEDEAGGLGPVEADLWVRVTTTPHGRCLPDGTPDFPSPRGRGEAFAPFWGEGSAKREGEGVSTDVALPAPPPHPRGEPAVRGSLRSLNGNTALSPPAGRGDMRSAQRSNLRADAPGTRATVLQLAVATPDGPTWLAPLPASTGLATVRTLLLGLATSGARRMRALPVPQRDALLSGLAPGEPAPATTTHPPGRHARALLAELPFGRCDAALLDRLAGWSESHGDGHLALTPSRGVALIARDEAAAEAQRGAAGAAGLIVDPADPRRAVAACPGAPACASGGTPAQGDAPRLAAAFAHLARLGATAHVSGCPKGCAHPGPATLTLVGRPDGRYGVVPEGHAGTETDLTLTFDAVLERLESVRDHSGLRDAFREPA
ncbi:nitrite reductase [Methylobacterium nonmethylotrophicum]|uniref:Nitrite reductase n=1 Tax=Methylobacterium nonmethylotrophicum TaxID=1141884 RepID=A0A4Z0NWS9_9HYPH|nr:nitrite reductase [Methylobacterium nonmethylotrophicum]TGE01938.1 nitrite reductase [Methylobacterium nonmethylotrophicum]